MTFLSFCVFLHGKVTGLAVVVPISILIIGGILLDVFLIEMCVCTVAFCDLTLEQQGYTMMWELYILHPNCTLHS